MTVISAIYSIRGIAVATDSLLTVKNPENNTYQQIQWQLPKVVRLEKFKGSISFWGDAVAAPKKILSDIDKIEYHWTLYEWLTERCKNISEETLEDYVRRLTEELKQEFTTKGWLKYGVGLHVTGYEYIEDSYIPELFLISNFNDTRYNSTKEMEYSRETYHTVMNVKKELFHREPQYRKAVLSFLERGQLIIYNNGDPNLFNPVFQALMQAYMHSKNLGNVNQLNTLKDLILLTRRPIEIISQFQSDFFLKDKILVGGKTHDLAQWRDGNYVSTSGD